MTKYQAKDFCHELVKNLNKTDLKTYLINFHGVTENGDDLFTEAWKASYKKGNICVAELFADFIKLGLTEKYESL